MIYAKVQLLLMAWVSVGCLVVANAQSPSFPVIPSPNGGAFGHDVSGVGDINGDGFDDFAVSAFGESSPTIGLHAGSVRVYSGLDGSLIHSMFGMPSEGLGHSVGGAGDTNADGVPDIIVGAFAGNGLTNAYVFSGLDGSTLLTLSGFRLGKDVAGLGDVNSDGHDDVVVSSFGTLSSNGTPDMGFAQVFSGFDGSLLYTLNGIHSNDLFGESVDGIGDINGDGVCDIIVGAPRSLTNGVFTGKAHVFSGVDGSTIYTLSGNFSFGDFGYKVSKAGDVDADGIPDFMVSVEKYAVGTSFAGGVRIYSGATGNLIRALYSDRYDYGFGGDLDAAGDVNGDGHDDVIILMLHYGNGDFRSSQIHLHSGIDGSKIQTLLGRDGVTTQSVSYIGDANGDGQFDFVAGSENDSVGGTFGSGAARVYFGDIDLGEQYYTTSSYQHYLSLEWQRRADTADGYLSLRGATPMGLGLFVSSLRSDDSLSFGFLPVLVDANPADVLLFQTFTFSSNGLILPRVVRRLPALAGVSIYMQGFQLSPTLLSSNGVRLPIL